MRCLIWRTVCRRQVFICTFAVWTALSGELRASVTYQATGTNAASGQVLSATAQFDVLAGNELQITLSNLGDAVLQPSDILTSLLFDLNGVGTLAPVSAVLGPGSGLTNGPVPAGQTLGDQWEYLGGLTGTPDGASRGISAAGLGLFGAGNFGSNGQNLDGYGYGIINGSPAGGNDGIPTSPLVNNSMVFTLSGLPNNFDLNNIANVGFQYGTMLSPAEPLLVAYTVPEPTTYGLLALGAAAVLCPVMRKARVKQAVREQSLGLALG